jgi:hypothetical protein
MREISGGSLIKKVEDYLRYAAECRDMARTASAAHRQQLEQMAEAWARLAKAGEDQLDERGATGGPGLVIEFEIPPDYGSDPKRRS